MSRLLKTSTGKPIVIDDVPIASGGQGAIFKIISPSTNAEIAKLYKRYSTAKKSQKKIEFMIKNSPIANSKQKVKEAIVWPIEPLYENKNFIGYVMPYISKTIALTDLCIPKPPQLVNGSNWQKFDIKSAQSFHIRLSICYNIAQAILELHKSKAYVLVDMKPDNIRINEKGHIAIIDLDSIQIATGAKVLYNAEVCTPDYAPPEHYAKKIVPHKHHIKENWDYFSFAVLSYQLLFTIHPFQGSHDKLTTIPELIEAGYFANGRYSNNFKVIPYFHKEFKDLIHDLRKLYQQCFDDGHKDPKRRPNFYIWRDALLKELISGNAQIIRIGNKRLNYTIKTQKQKYTQTTTQTPITTYSPPVISYFRQPVIHAYHATLSWSAPNAISILLNGKPVATTGTLNVPLFQNTFTIVATDSSSRTDTQTRYLNVPIVVPLANIMVLQNIRPITHRNIKLGTQLHLKKNSSLTKNAISLLNTFTLGNFKQLELFKKLREQSIMLNNHLTLK